MLSPLLLLPLFLLLFLLLLLSLFCFHDAVLEALLAVSEHVHDVAIKDVKRVDVPLFRTATTIGRGGGGSWCATSRASSSRSLICNVPEAEAARLAHRDDGRVKVPQITLRKRE
jgi:hypothetical protein